MKIIQVCPRYPPYTGGLETHVSELSEKLVERGIEVEIFTTDPSGTLPSAEVKNGVTIRRVKSYAPNEAFFIAPQIYTNLKKEKCDIIHIHSYHAFTSLFGALAKGKRRLVFTPHTGSFGLPNERARRILYRMYKPAGKLIYKLADVVISVSKIEEKWIRKHFDVDGKVVRIPLFVRIGDEEIKFEKSPGKKVAYVGRLHRRKNVDVLLHAFKLVKKTSPLSELFIVGDGPMDNRLKRMSSCMSGVKFLGSLPNAEVKNLLREEINVLVLPSPFETFGLCVLEAMAYGVPVVVTPVGDFPYILRDRKTCLFTKIGDPIDLARKVEALFDQELAEEISENARVFVKKYHADKKVIDRYVLLYQRLLD